jgi:hypothetical protein
MNRIRIGLASLATAVALGCVPAVHAGHTAATRDERIKAEFLQRVKDYLHVHEQASATLPRLSRDAGPTEIDRHQRALGRAVEQLRPKAKQGDLFTKETRAYFRRQMIRAFSGPEGRLLRKSIMDENPGPIRLRVNGRYPDTVPLSTMPPTVLAELPELSAPLQYRFIGKRLILLDVDAHIIVDFIENALPN